MTLRYRWGEFGEVNPIRCVDSNKEDEPITYADVTKTKVYILSESKTQILLTIGSADLSIVSPVINWTPTKVQSETIPPGHYRGEAHVTDTGESRKAIFEFPVFIEKAHGNI